MTAHLASAKTMEPVLIKKKHTYAHVQMGSMVRTAIWWCPRITVPVLHVEIVGPV